MFMKQICERRRPSVILPPPRGPCSACSGNGKEQMTSSATYFFDSLWPGLILWGLLYVSDYYLTLTCARMYRGGASEKIAIEGSYEITPYFQSDIDSLRVVSPRFVAAFLWSGAWLALTWWFSLQSTAALYQIVLGAMISTELAIHVRHVRNFFLFRAAATSDVVRGRIEYSRLFMLRMSSIELLAFSGLFLLLFIFTQSWFTLGGAMSCLVTAGKHLKLAHKSPPAMPSGARPGAAIES